MHGEYVSIDSILEKHGLDKVEGRCIPLQNFIKANEIVLSKVRKKLNEGKIIVFDGNFYHKKQIKHLIQNLSTPNYIFTLKAPLETCIKRDKQRDVVYGEDATTAVYNLVSRFDYGILIDTANKNLDQVVKEIISYLPRIS